MPVTHRLKRFETTVQKLRRQRTRLPSAYSEREAETLGTTREVVLLGAECEDDLRRTHSRYFVQFDTSGRFLSNGKNRQETVNRVSRYAEQLARKG